MYVIAQIHAGRLQAPLNNPVMEEMSEAEAQRRTGLNEQKWQQQVGPYVQEKVIASGDYPFLARSIVEIEA